MNKFDVIKDSAFSTRHSTEVTFNFLVRSYDSTRIVLLEILSILFCQHTSQISYLKREFVWDANESKFAFLHTLLKDNIQLGYTCRRKKAIRIKNVAPIIWTSITRVSKLYLGVKLNANIDSNNNIWEKDS